MKIVKCSKCGRVLYKATRCLYCGNLSDFQDLSDINPHPNAAMDFAHLEVLISEKKFEDAYKASNSVLEWMPNSSAVFWLRLLAKNHCADESYLVCKGFSCEDSDFYNALRFSSDEEHAFFVDIQRIENELKDALLKAILIHEHRCKSETDIMSVHKDMQGEIDRRKQRLVALWEDLSKVETSLYSIEADCRLLENEYKTELMTASQTAASVKSDTYHLDECTAEKRHSYQVKMGNALLQSTSAKDSMDNMRNNHPWVKSFANLTEKRNHIIKDIDNELESLKTYEQNVQRTIDEIALIEDRHRIATENVEKYSFLNAAELLGSDTFNMILSSIGVIISPSLNVPKNGWKSSSVSQKKTNSVDYNSAWGLTEN